MDIRLKYASSLSAMRRQMIEESVARIVVGGKLKGFTGHMAGIVEEFKLSVEKSHPVYLVGGFGGAAQFIANIIEGRAASKDLLIEALEDPQYKELYEWCEANGEHIQYESLDDITIDNLNNGLTESDNKSLFHSVDIIEIISLILKGLNNIIK